MSGGPVDLLSLRAGVLAEYGRTPRRLADAVLALRKDLEEAREEIIRLRSERPCEFPAHRDYRGHVTHVRYLTPVEDDPEGDSCERSRLLACVVCGHVWVESSPIVALAGASP